VCYIHQDTNCGLYGVQNNKLHQVTSSSGKVNKIDKQQLLATNSSYDGK